MFCQKCGKENNDDALICAACGCELPKGVQARKVEEAKKMSPLYGIIGDIVGFIVFCIILGFLS